MPMWYCLLKKQDNYQAEVLLFLLVYYLSARFHFHCNEFHHARNLIFIPSFVLPEEQIITNSELKLWSTWEQMFCNTCGCVFQFLRLRLPGCWINRELTYLTSSTQRCFQEMWVCSTVLLLLFICLCRRWPVCVLFLSHIAPVFPSLCCRVLRWLRWTLVSPITFWLSSSGRPYNNWKLWGHIWF